ncbi:hypothetical protein BpHYR1_036593 [Brachionus plicatilis]|uniref:FHA domain-containing protein n=1 Tax=Brachionus plicatilis TaxID=10195 RepID=A0A3M7T380_BRAPC|nr:hypothetical protein BpHYR1_036593 [Brachionus plicatilis]
MSDETQKLENQDTQIATLQIETNETSKQNGHTDENSKTPANMSNLCLKLISHVTKSTIFPLNIGSTTLGRSKSSDICLIHKSVSRNHGCIQVDLNKDPHELHQCVLIDQGSLNKTRLNNTELTKEDKTTLNINDQIEVGALKFKLEKMTDDQVAEQQLNRTSSIDLYEVASPSKTKPGLLEIQNTMEETMLIEDEKSQPFNEDTDPEDSNLDNTSCPDFRLHMSMSFINQSVVSNKSLVIPETMTVEQDESNDDSRDQQNINEPIHSDDFTQTLLVSDTNRDEPKTVLVDTQLQESETMIEEMKESQKKDEIEDVDQKEMDEKMIDGIKESQREDDIEDVDQKKESETTIEEIKESQKKDEMEDVDQNEVDEKMIEGIKESQRKDQIEDADQKEMDEKMIEGIKESQREDDIEDVDQKKESETTIEEMKESQKKDEMEDVDQNEVDEKMIEGIKEKMKESQMEDDIEDVDQKKESETMIDEMKESQKETEINIVDEKEMDGKMIEEMKESQKENKPEFVDQKEMNGKIIDEFKEVQKEEKTSENVGQKEDSEKVIGEIKESQKETEINNFDEKEMDGKMTEKMKESQREEKTSESVDLKEESEKVIDEMKESHKEEIMCENVYQKGDSEKLIDEMKEMQKKTEIKNVVEKMTDESKEEKKSENVDHQKDDGEEMKESSNEDKKTDEPKRRGRPKKSDSEPKKKSIGRPGLSSVTRLSREEEKAIPIDKNDQKESSDFEVKKYNCLNDESIIINDDDDDEIDLAKLKNQKNIILAEPDKLPDEIMIESTLMDTSVAEQTSQLSDTQSSQTVAPARRGKGRPRSIHTAKIQKSPAETKAEEKQRRRSTRISLPEREDTENIAEEASEQKPEAKIARRSSLRVRNTPNLVVRPKRGAQPLEEENGHEQRKRKSESVRKTLDTSHTEHEPKKRGRPRLVKEEDKLSPKPKPNDKEHSKVKKSRRAKKNDQSSDDEDNETLGNVKKMLRKQSAEAELSPKIFFNSKRRKTPNSSISQTPKATDNADTPSKKFKLHKAISSSDENLNDDVEDKAGQESGEATSDQPEQKVHPEEEEEEKEKVEEEEGSTSLPAVTTRHSNRTIRNQN